jgi:hypothetical protein
MYSRRGWSRGTTDSVHERPSLTLLAPLPIALVIVGVLAWYHFVFTGFGFDGTIVDANTGRGVPGARVWSGSAVTVTGADGTFQLAAAKPPELVSVDAPGYASAEVRATMPSLPIQAALQPRTAELQVVDAETGAAIPGASASGLALGDGRFQLAPAQPGEEVQAQAAGYVPGAQPYDGADVFQLPLAPRYTGHVVDDQSGQPIARAHVQAGGTEAVSESDGAFSFVGPLSDHQLIALAPGYKRATVDVGAHRDVTVRLQPNVVRAVYLTHDAVRLPEFREHLSYLLDTTEVNAVVIDVKGDRGYLTYPSAVPLAQQIGANDNPTAPDIDQLIHDLHARNVYVIGRLVVFKDDLLARNGPRAGVDVAIKDRRNGQPWVDGEGLAWVDAFQPAAWSYNSDLAREAIQHGFDEVQLDYIRFPTDPPPGGSVDDTQYSQPFTATNRVAALKSFLSQTHTAVQQAGGYLSIDTFGLTTWWDHSDGGIGQDVAELADDIDYLCPMVYPSTFGSGIPGGMPYPDVVEHPYDLVFQSLTHAISHQLAGTHVVVRPWLQYFDDYGDKLDGYRYDEPQIEAQKKAAADAGARGWMLWDPTNEYTRGGLDVPPTS